MSKQSEASRPLPHWTDHWQTSEVVCPWCGDTWIDSWEDAGCEDDMHDDVECDECGRRFTWRCHVECDECGRRFTWRCDVKVTYTTRRIEEDSGNGPAGGGE